MISTNEGRGGTAPRVLPNRRALRRSLDAWKRAAIPIDFKVLIHITPDQLFSEHL